MAYILIVDDDGDFADSVSRVLRAAGHETAVELSPEAGLASISARAPDLAILDVMFPEGESAGFDLARRVRSTQPRVRILMLTAVNQKYPLGFSREDMDEHWLPVTDFLEKPVRLKALEAKVASLLQTAAA
ncbi:MAG: response regulator [Gemmatimonadota bacterium]